MTTFTLWMAVIVTLLTIAALLKRWETRLVLFASGLLMATLSLDPMAALNAFANNMTRGSLIMSICSSMGFAAAISITRCDVQLVSSCVKPLGRLGVFLLPACMLVASCVAVAVPGAAIIGSISPSTLSPGSSHNVFIAQLADMKVMDLIVSFTPEILTVCALNIILVTAMVFVFKDYKKPGPDGVSAFAVEANEHWQLTDRPNYLMAVAPILPVVILFLGATCLPAIRMSIPAAMLIGTVYAMIVARANPATVTKEFFTGMGKGYANIMGIIIAAGTFAGGLQAAGVIDALISTLKESNDIARYAANFGPFVMGVLTGSGDAAGHAFNQAVTPHAASFGMDIASLGMVAALSGALGRMCSPLAGATIVVAGMTRMTPLDISKRMAIPMLINLVLLGFIFDL